MTRERITRSLELREMFLSLKTGFNVANAAVVCDILESISCLEPSSVIAEPKVLKACSPVSLVREPVSLVCYSYITTSSSYINIWAKETDRLCVHW